MIITLTRADFSSCKIGTLTTFNVRKSTVIGASVNIIKTSVERAGYSSATTIATIVLDEANYEGHAIKVMMGSTDVSSWYSSGKVTVPKNTPITSNITISVSATAVSGNDPIIPDVPVTPTMYTYTIKPTPSTASVTLIASGYTQSGNSISVASGTTVSWTVSADGYFDKNGNETITRDKTLNVSLSKIPNPGSGGDTNLLSTLQFSAPSDMSYDNTQYKLTSSNNVSSIISDGAAKQWILSNVPIGKGKEVEFDIVMTGTNGFYTFGLTPSNNITNIGDSCIYTKTHPILCGFPNFYYDYGNQVKNGDKFQCYHLVISSS